ncbi:hypothetical protein EDD18DRAFT_1104439 [Armillaria luteobubalina]|uniref:Integrase zinc-binding domain-containing protein n=1 Tax=Armillaria luteobubalina TaxID=153913 RepID=A0AA39UPL5_9AGAR|nr:hypothetical protein EDD18DRAFT_1104439 [Armillaria luteobubalina]
MSSIRTQKPRKNVRKPYSLAESTVTASRHMTTKKNAPISPLHLAQFHIISRNYFNALPTDAALEDYSLTDQERSLLVSWTLDEDSVDETTLHPRLAELLPELSVKTRCHGIDLLLHRGRPVAIREELASIIISTHAEKHANGASNYHIIDKRFACVPASLVLAWAMSCPSCFKENTCPTRVPSITPVLAPLSKHEGTKKLPPLHCSSNTVQGDSISLRSAYYDVELRNVQRHPEARRYPSEDFFCIDPFYHYRRYRGGRDSGADVETKKQRNLFIGVKNILPYLPKTASTTSI